MDRGKVCISLFADTAAELAAKIAEARRSAEIVEVRYDSLRPEEVEPGIEAAAASGADILATFRPAEQGGRRSLSLAEREDFWRSLHRTGSWGVDAEPDIAKAAFAVNSELKIASWHGPAPGGSEARALMSDLARTGADAVKIAFPVEQAHEALPVWSLITEAAEAGVRLIPIGMGEAGKWTRILGPAFGSPITYASLRDPLGTAPGQISSGDMNDVFRVRDIGRGTRVYGILAGDTSYSMSPYIHNAAFAAAELDRVFVPMQIANVAEFFRTMVRASGVASINFGGFSVTNPHKRSVIEHLDEIEDSASKIGAVNTIVVAGGRSTGMNTDAIGFIRPLIARSPLLRGKRAVVIGSGGAARACVFALVQQGVAVTVIARNTAIGTEIADEFGAEYQPLSDFDRPLEADILVNATPAGTRGPSEKAMPIPAAALNGVGTVYDLTYNPQLTPLISEARAAGCETIGGIEMLIEQAMEQFRIWTGAEPSRAVMENAVRVRLAQLEL